MDKNKSLDSRDIEEDISKNEHLTGTVQSKAFSVEEMAKKFNIDLTVWEKDRIVTNVWPMGAKDIQKDLVFESGVATGTVKSGGIIVTHLWQTKIWWVRKTPVALAPILYPVDTTGFSFSRPAKFTPHFNPEILVIPDIHAGYIRKDGIEIPMHDEQALNIIRSISKRYFFSHIVLLGDVLDFAEWTDHFPTPNEQRDTTQKALIDMSAFIAQLRADNGDANIVYIEGNHEKRMRSILLKLVPAAYGLKAVGDLEGFPAMSIPGLLGLKELNVSWIGDYPSGEYWVDDTLRFIHSSIARKSGLTAAHFVNTNEVSTVFGHTHRIEMASRTTWRAGKPHSIFAASPGYLGRLDDSSIIPATKDRNNWQQGAMVLSNIAGSWQPEQIHIENGTGFFRGEIIDG